MNKLWKSFKPTINISTSEKVVGLLAQKTIWRTHEDMDFNEVRAWTCQCTSNTQISVKLNGNHLIFKIHLFHFREGEKVTELGKDDSFLVVCSYCFLHYLHLVDSRFFPFSVCHSSKYWPYLKVLTRAALVLTIQFTSYAYWLFCCYCDCCVHHYFLAPIYRYWCCSLPLTYCNIVDTEE